MVDDQEFSEDFDAALDDILPSDLEGSVEQAAAEADEDLPPGAWLVQRYNYSHGLSPSQQVDTAQGEIDALTTSLDVDDTVQQLATSLFTQFVKQADQNFLVELYAAAAVYCACKVNEIPVSPDEISAASGELLTRTVLLRRSKRIASTLGLDASVFIEPTQYVDRYCEELHLSDDIAQRANVILERVAEAGLTGGKSPRSVAAAAVYISGLEHGAGVTQADVSKAAGVTQVTIRNRYQEQQEFLNQAESTPDDPEDVVEWAADRLKTPESIRTRAQELLKRGLEELPTAQHDRNLALAALRLASEESPNQTPLSYRSLRGLTDADSSRIQSRRCRLKGLHAVDIGTDSRQ